MRLVGKTFHTLAGLWRDVSGGKRKTRIQPDPALGRRARVGVLFAYLTAGQNLACIICFPTASLRGMPGAYPGIVPRVARAVLSEHFRQVLWKAPFSVLPVSTRTAIAAAIRARSHQASLPTACQAEAGRAEWVSVTVTRNA